MALIALRNPVVIALTSKGCPLLPGHGGDPGGDDERLGVPQAVGEGHGQPQHSRHVHQHRTGHRATSRHKQVYDDSCYNDVLLGDNDIHDTSTETGHQGQY